MRKQFLTRETWVYLNIVVWGIFAVVASIGWLSGVGTHLWYLFLPVMMISTVLQFGWVLLNTVGTLYSRWQILFSAIFLVSIIQQFLGVFLPETSFDALWYHLPAIDLYLESGRMVFTHELYQTAYPQYADILFLLGKQLHGMVGVKLVAFMASLLLYSSIDTLMQKSQPVQRLAVLSSVSLFHVVTWQSSAAYVDVWSAVFFLTGIALSLKEWDAQPSRGQYWSVVLIGLVWGVFVGTKFINIAFIPLLISVLVLTMLNFKKPVSSIHITLWKILVCIAVLFLISGVWFIRAWYYTGSILYPMGTMHAVPVIQQMGVDGWSEWLRLRVQTLYRLPVDFFILNREYFTPLLGVFLLILMSSIQRWNRKSYLLVICGLYGVLFWYFFPPPSSRYVLGPIIVLWMTVVDEVVQVSRKAIWKMIIYGLIFSSSLSILFIRQVVLMRGVLYLQGTESQQQYLDRFRNGFLDEKIDAYYD